MPSILIAVRPTIEAFLAKARTIAASDWIGISSLTSQFGELLFALIETITAEMDGDTATDGESKKLLVLDAVGKLFDAAAPAIVASIPLPLLLKPLWVMASPSLIAFARSWTLKVADGMIEAALKRIRSGQLTVKGA